MAKIIKSLLLVSFFFLTACVESDLLLGTWKGSKAHSAIYLKCPEEQIKVTNLQRPFGSNVITWTASCQGRTIYCSSKSHAEWVGTQAISVNEGVNCSFSR